MKDFKEINNYLQQELVTAMGCTEPIAVAYTVATAIKYLDEKPTSLIVTVSVNLLKNAAGVVVPNSGNRKGVHSAAVLGALLGNSDLGLEVITNVTQDQLDQIQEYFDNDFCKIISEFTPIRVYIKVEAFSQNHSVLVELKHTHTGIVKIIKDNIPILSEDNAISPHSEEEKSLGLTIDMILDYIESPEAAEIFPFVHNQIENNMSVARHGLSCDCTNSGLNVGKTLLKRAIEGDLLAKAKAYTAASSDARMGGCALPVGTVCGSGNQGMTASVSLTLIAKEIGCSKEMLYKSVLLSDLVASHIKSSMGRLSPYCGVITAGVGVSAGIVYLYQGNHKQIKTAINNMLGNISGVFCDGAKSTCAAKCASSIDAAFQAAWLALDGYQVHGKEGIVDGDDVEQTIQNIIEIATIGMKEVDKVVCHIMTRQ